MKKCNKCGKLVENDVVICPECESTDFIKVVSQSKFTRSTDDYGAQTLKHTIKCLSCGAEMNRKAISCPGCGLPTKTFNLQIEIAGYGTLIKLLLVIFCIAYGILAILSLILFRYYKLFV